MTAKQILALGTSVLFSSLFWGGRHAAAQQQGRIVRIAELEVDPTQLETYKAALREEIETSLRAEPGVLSLFAVSLKEQPTQIRILETYADEAAYRAHLETTHFKKYKTGTQGMVKSLKLIETEPIMLGTKLR
jgi:quinol monooxygenase YgiN